MRLKLPFPLHFNFRGGKKSASAFHQGDALGLEKSRDAAAQARNHPLFPGDDSLDVGVRLHGLKAKFPCPAHGPAYFGGGPHRLGGDAAPVEADAA